MNTIKSNRAVSHRASRIVPHSSYDITKANLSKNENLDTDISSHFIDKKYHNENHVCFGDEDDMVFEAEIDKKDHLEIPEGDKNLPQSLASKSQNFLGLKSPPNKSQNFLSLNPLPNNIYTTLFEEN